jgi:exosome complex component RRP4
MPITILPPVVEDLGPYQNESDDSMSVDSDEDVEMGGVSLPSKRSRVQGDSKIGTGIVTPGEVVTDDPQWMRLVAPKSCAEVP